VYEFNPSGARSTFATGLDFPFGIAIQASPQSTPEPNSILLLSGGAFLVMIGRMKRNRRT